MELIPKAYDFAARFKWAIILSIAGLCILTIVLINYSSLSDHNSAPETKSNSEEAIASIKTLDTQNTPIILLDNWALLLNGKKYLVYKQDDQIFANIEGQKTALKDGEIIYKNGKAYMYKDGKLIPLADAGDQNIAHPMPGDLVMKDGKLYQVGADGKLHLYKGKLKAGQIVWKDGKPYVVGVDGKLHAVGDKPQVGDLVMKDGKLYQVGADGKLHLYKGKLKPGQIVWKNGKPYVVGVDGKLHAIGDKPQAGDLVMKDGQLYQVGKDGKLHPYLGGLKAGQVVWKNGKAYMVGADGKLHPIKNGTVRMIDGKPYVWENGKWVPLSSKGAKAGDLVVGPDGKLYRMGADGKLHPDNGKLNPGDIIWKDGKPYLVGADGKYHALADGETFVGADGKRYMYKDGKIIPMGAPLEAKQDNATAGNTQNLEEAYKSSLIAYKDSVATKKSTEKSAGDDAAMDSQMTAFKAQSAELSKTLASSNEYSQQNGQSQKTAFLKADNGGSTTAKGKFEHPKSQFTAYAGTIIPASLQTGIDSDLPGNIWARVTQNVYDTRTGNYLLIPQGTLVQGKYDSSISYGQSRVLVVFTRLLFPNGSSVPLDNQPGADLRGYAGLTGDVNNHYWRVFGNALMFSIFGAAGQLSQPSGDSGNSGTSNQQIVYAAIGQQMTQTAAQMVQKNMNIQPTIKAAPGTDFSIVTTRDIVFPSYYHFDK